MNATLELPTTARPSLKLLPTGTEFSAATTEAEFLASPDGSHSSVSSSNPPYFCHQLGGNYELYAERFMVNLWFDSGRLTTIELTMSDETRSWADWSEQRERDKHRRQVEMLVQEYGANPAKLGWGKISSAYDPRSGESAITIRFG